MTSPAKVGVGIVHERDQFGAQSDSEHAGLFGAQPIVAIPIELGVVERAAKNGTQAAGGVDEGVQERGRAAR